MMKPKYVCKFNWKVTARNMEPVGVKRIWQFSIVKNKLCYTEFYGNGDIIN